MDGPTVTDQQPLRHKDILKSLDSRKEANEAKEGLFANIDTRSFVVACLANLYEYYDFALLGFFAEQVGGALFPNGNDVTYAIEVYTLYAVGFLFRPFGGAFFGYMGDKVGRKNALRMAMIMMAFPTFLTGCLPTYDMIGWWSPALLLFFRVVQGLSTGGENSNVATYVYEIAQRDKRAFFMSLLGISTSGTLVASVFHVILTGSMSESDLQSYGWRIPFWFGIGLIFVAIWGKKSMQESSTFVEMENHAQIKNNPLKYACNNHFDILLKFMFVSCLQHGSAYSTYVFLPSYLSSESMHGWSDHSAYAINAINNVISLPLVLLVGYFTDKAKYKAATFLFPGCILAFLFSPVLFWGFSQTQKGMTGIWMDWLLQFILTCIYSLIHGCIYYWYISKLLMDPRTRVTLFGVGYNLGAACFGGTASLIGSGFVAGKGSEIGTALLGVWLSVLAVVAFSIIFYVERKSGNRNGLNENETDVSYLSGLPFGAVDISGTRNNIDKANEQESLIGDSNITSTQTHDTDDGGDYEPINTDKEE